jgi:hypothetical protein
MAVGYYVGEDDEDCLSPLDDFGTPNWGCTTIAYWNESKKIFEDVN